MHKQQSPELAVSSISLGRTVCLSRRPQHWRRLLFWLSVIFGSLLPKLGLRRLPTLIIRYLINQLIIMISLLLIHLLKILELLWNFSIIIQLIKALMVAMKRPPPLSVISPLGICYVSLDLTCLRLLMVCSVLLKDPFLWPPQWSSTRPHLGPSFGTSRSWTGVPTPVYPHQSSAFSCSGYG